MDSCDVYIKFLHCFLNNTLYFRKMQIDEQKMINNLVYQYLNTISDKLASKFLKEYPNSNEQTSISIEQVVNRYFEKHQNSCGSKGTKRDSDNLDSDKSENKKVKPQKKRKIDAERKTVFIRNIGKEFDFSEHKPTFEKFGQIFGFTNSGKGHGFLTYSTSSEAAACIDALNRTTIDGKTVQLNLARGSQGKYDSESKDCKIFIHGVKQETKEESLKDVFSNYGKVVDCFNPGKGFAFVTFEHSEEAAAAIEKLNGQELFGSVLSMNLSTPKEKEKNKKKTKKKEGKNLSESARIFVKNVDKDSDMEEVKRAFENHGTVKDVYNPGKGFIFVR